MSIFESGQSSGGPSVGEQVARFLGSARGDPVARADLDMTRVLEELRALAPEPIEDLTPEAARRQPTPSDAVRALIEKTGLEIAPDGVVSSDVRYPGAEDDLPARIYRTFGDGTPRPIVLYFHGGGWVFGGLDAYDATPRAIAARTGAVVVSAHYRLAPEHKFPAAHDDAIEAYRWVIEEAEALGGDPSRIAVMGESAGGNLAINVAIAARDRGLPLPTHQVLITPVAGVDMETPSYQINEHARPLNKAMMGWCVGHALADALAQENPRLDLVGRAELRGLPPTTLITAEIDPLRWEGQALAEKLRAAGVAVNAVDFEGVTHEFFGMSEVVRAARLAQETVARDLAAAFAADERGARVGRAL